MVILTISVIILSIVNLILLHKVSILEYNTEYLRLKYNELDEEVLNKIKGE